MNNLFVCRLIADTSAETNMFLTLVVAVAEDVGSPSLDHWDFLMAKFPAA